MTYIENINTSVVRQPGPLVRVWRSSGQPGTPLVSTWVYAELTKLRPALTTRRAAK